MSEIAENAPTSKVVNLQAEKLISDKPVSLWGTARRRLFKRKSAVLGMVVLSILVLIAIFAPLLAPYDPQQVLIGVEKVKARQAPCIHLLGCPADQPQHLMGIDGNVRDEFSRVLYGARLSLIIGFTTVSFAIIIGTTIGALAGYLGGSVDNVLMRFMDVLLAFPSLLLAIALVTSLGPGLTNALLAIGIVSIPAFARVTRSAILTTPRNGLCSRLTCPGWQHLLYLVSANFTQLVDTFDRDWNIRYRDCHPGCSCPVFPRPGSTATHTGMGVDVECGTQPGFHCSISGGLPRAIHHAGGAFIQPVG